MGVEPAAFLGNARFDPFHADMDPAFAECNLSTTDCSRCHDTTGLTVDEDRLCEAIRPGCDPCIVQVAGRGFASEIDEMHNPLLVDRRLGLNPFVGRVKDSHPGRVDIGRTALATQDDATSQQSEGDDPIST
jgi:hypothetical protein